MKVVYSGRFLAKSKSEEDLNQQILAAEAQINQLKAHLNDANSKKKHADAESAVSTL